MGVVRATSTISLSNPVKRRFIAPLDDVQPTIKVIVTETHQDGCEVSLDKPRKPRKENLAKVVKNRQVTQALEKNVVPWYHKKEELNMLEVQAIAWERYPMQSGKGPSCSSAPRGYGPVGTGCAEERAPLITERE